MDDITADIVRAKTLEAKELALQKIIETHKIGILEAADLGRFIFQGGTYIHPDFRDKTISYFSKVGFKCKIVDDKHLFISWEAA